MIELDQSQIEAVEQATKRRFTIINGGAGCGKTTIIREIAGRLSDRGEKVALCAFAGKAAARLKEATGRPATTIHSLLGSDGVKFREPPFPERTVIVDESSMVNSCLLAEIVRRKPRRLILVGDQAQLAPVGPGQPFHDIIGIYPETVHTLTTCYRNSEAVFKAATAIRNGRMPLLHDRSDNETWDVYNTGGEAETQQVILDWVQKGVFDFEQDIILTYRKGDRSKETGEIPPCTVDRLNEEIVKIVNPRSSDETRKFLPGDRVINTKNNPDKDVWNGTTGTVHAIDEDGKMWLRLDIPIPDPVHPGETLDRVLLTRDEQKELHHAYALTVHKAQGSQYRKVLFVCLNRDRYHLDRSLVYTAVTRTKQSCIIVGQVEALTQSLWNIKSKQTVIQLVAGRI